MYAKSQNAGKVITLLRTISYVDLFKSVGLESIVSPKSSTSSYILRYVRSMSHTKGSKIETLHRLMENKVEALEFLVKDNIEGLTDVPLKELKLLSGVLIACIDHKDKILIPSGNDVISKGDTVIIVTTQTQINDIGEILK
jgi:trk system potassium uptake protein TrkA